MSAPPYLLESFHDPATGTVSHLLACPRTRRAALIDPVLDFQANSGKLHPTSAQRLVERVRALDLQVDWLLETHAHADHLSAAVWLQRQLGGRIAIGAGIDAVQAHFQPLLDLTAPCDAGAFDQLFAEGDRVPLGELSLQVLHTPGHTPACISYYLPGTPEAPGCVFVGDTLFSPDYGCARADFPGGDAVQLYRSIQRLLALPDATRVMLCHDYPPAGRAPCLETTVAVQRASNVQVGGGVSEADFVARRQARDRQLAVPALLWPSLQVNLRGGRLPEPDAQGRRFLRIPLGLPE
ncbi:MBL fold metallo-hydrolase [Inhella proteolytica]|uniref:MBL fold metallo-hydrolase n=1 Tax=Inhella proteolytica TaxID=2795029 RepID=A0A931NG83_9BURK|nr:MBL fold metallo-hydrolase [Inhella proteolytica]MBH9576886.1 MBL fold metallo-hydrolase [Inhella proteolytica]